MATLVPRGHLSLSVRRTASAPSARGTALTRLTRHTRPDTTNSMLESKLSELILDCFFFVYKQFGYGFLEAVYANALATELEYRGVRVQREVTFDLYHRGRMVGRYRADLLVENKILIEVKSTRQLVEADERQLLNFLKATPIEVGFCFTLARNQSS